MLDVHFIYSISKMEWPLPRVTEEESARLRRIPDEFRQCFLDLFGAPAEIAGSDVQVVLL
jgi:hypothetical protein